MSEFEEKEYGPMDVRPLREIVTGFVKTRATCDIKIRSSGPRYWFGRRALRHVHCNMRYKNGTETFRSKNCTDDVMNMNVVRTRFDAEHGTLWIAVFAPYGRPKNWFSEKNQNTDQTPRWATTCRGAMMADLLAESGDDDELPF